MKVAVIGTGYVGLVSGACLAEVGNDVLCLDVDPEKIRILEAGGIPIHEPGLQEMVRRNVAAGRLHFSTDVERSVHHGTIQFIAVGTPPDEDGSADLQHVLAAARNIGRVMTDYKVVVDKSTVPVGTGDAVDAAVAEELRERGLDIPYSVVSNPEFLKEGAAVEDFMRPDRIVVGASSDQAIDLMRALRAVPAQPRTADRHQPAQRRTDQVRGECNARDADQFHERTRQPRRSTRCRHRDGPPWNRCGSANRLSVPLPWLWLWRVMFPERRQGADPNGAQRSGD